MHQPAVSLISRGDIARLLSVSRSLELARIAYVATATGDALHSSLGHVAAPDGEFHIKGSGLILDGRLVAAVKVAAYFPERTRTLGQPSIVGVIALFDGANGQPLAVMESELITKLRTAAGTAVALDQLARVDARRLLVCGTGAQALPHIEAVAAIRNLESVHLWSRTPEHAQATLTELRQCFPDLQSEIAPDVGAAARHADLIVCLTSASKPYLHAGAVRPGTTIAAVGSDTPDKQELSTELLASAALVCDVTQQCAQTGELHHALAASATDDAPRTRSSFSTRPAPRSRAPPPPPPSTWRPLTRPMPTSGP